MSTSQPPRYDIDAYTGIYGSRKDKKKAFTIWRDRDTLCIKKLGSSDTTYLIARHPFDYTGSPGNSFPVGRATSDIHLGSTHKHLELATAGHMTTVRLSDIDEHTIFGLRWKTNADAVCDEFTKKHVSPCIGRQLYITSPQSVKQISVTSSTQIRQAFGRPLIRGSYSPW